MIKLCIFDLDGTILNTLSTITHFVNTTFDKHGIRRITEDECKYFVGDGARLLIERALDSRGISGEGRVVQLLSEYNEIYHKNTLYLTKVYEGIPELIHKLKERGIYLAVLSNKPDEAAKSVVSHFFGSAFDIVLGAREGVPLKPDPAAALEIMESLGVTGEECAWIGDTNTDMQTAKAISAALSVGVLWGFREGDELARYGADLLAKTADEIYKGVVALG